MFLREAARSELEFYRGLNEIVEPLVRSGFLSPGIFPTGAIVVETIGRSTGRNRNIPLLATLVGGGILVGTVRNRSQWIRNLAANPDVRYWMGGRPHAARAYVFAPGVEPPAPDALPLGVACLAPGLIALSRFYGMSFAILVPVREGRVSASQAAA